jgi:hypothetical protein
MAAPLATMGARLLHRDGIVSLGTKVVVLSRRDMNAAAAPQTPPSGRCLPRQHAG